MLALAATAMLSGCWNSSGTAQPSPTASLAPTATADNPVEGALDELATDMPGSLEGGAATTAPLDENAGDVNDRKAAIRVIQHAMDHYAECFLGGAAPRVDHRHSDR